MADIKPEQLIKASLIKKIAKASGKRVGKDFLALLNDHVARKVTAAVATHNGGRKTLDVEVGVLVGLKG